MNNLLEKLFDKLDKHLHKETYVQLQDKVFSLEVDAENNEEIIRLYREDAEEKEWRAWRR